ncbi:MAG: HAD family hydrolase [Synechococcales bacterium]|nr:HAD family hydrolase [Synechococcales bacterium]
MPRIQLVVFDMAGTTVQDNDEVQNCFQAAAESTGLATDPARINAMMGWSKIRVFETLWKEQIGDDHPDYYARVNASFVTFCDRLETHYQTQPVEPTPGCLETFAWLQSQGIQIALTTGFYRKVTNLILQRLGWDQGLNEDFIGTKDSMIQASITPSEIYLGEGRPAPYMIQKAMYRLGIKDPQTVVKVGDTPSDLEAGINAHCLWSLGVTSGTHSREQLVKYPNHGLLDSLLELRDRIIGSL